MLSPVSAARTPLRILVLTRSYPAAGDLYQYPFVHRRVLAYRAAGHEVAVFRPIESGVGRHEFEGITCNGGDPEAFRAFAEKWEPDVIAAHGFSEAMWPALKDIGTIPVRAWLHGSEIPAFFRRKAEAVADPGERQHQLSAVAERCAFWNRLLEDLPPTLKLVFVSNSAVGLAREDWGERLHEHQFEIVPNPIDTDLFTYVPKEPDDRFAILMIRPFDSW